MGDLCRVVPLTTLPGTTLTKRAHTYPVDKDQVSQSLRTEVIVPDN